jgi:hypothetical protein
MVPRKDLDTEEGRIKARKDSKRHYERHKPDYLARNTKDKHGKRDFIRQYKEFHGCMDCSGKFPYFVLDLDHRDPHNKKYAPNRIHLVASWDQMVEEINKCDVVCSNCHRVRSHEKEHHFHRNVVTEEKRGSGVERDSH